MGLKDFVYLALIGFSSMFCFLCGYRRTSTQPRPRRKLDVPFNDSGCLTELPVDHTEKSAPRVKSVPKLSPAEIRAVFGNN